MTSIVLAVLIAAGAQKYEGRVQRYDAKSGKIFLLLSDRSTGNWTLSPQAKVFGANHKPSTRAAIHPGEQVEAMVNQDGTVVTVWIEEADWGKQYEGGKVRRWDGRVVAIKKRDPLTFEVMRGSGGAKMMFAVNPNTKYVRLNGTGSADDVKDGAAVRVLMNTQQRKVYEVMILE
ncbi:MAG: hypothetical protein ABR567_06445 [Myxococcales bacterium]|nr:hypothetical protein [Myxococcales bacterium]